MAKIFVTSLSDVIGHLPDITQFPTRSGREVDSEDLFFCTLGFEPRCLSIPMALKDEGYKVHGAVYFQYGTNHDENDLNRPALSAILEHIADSVSPMEVDSPDFGNRLRSAIKAACDSANGPPKITLDISVAANRLLVTCMKIFLEYNVDLRILYSEASVYHPTRLEYEHQKTANSTEVQAGLEQGVSDVMVSREFPGVHLDPQPDALLLFPNFKSERSGAVISFVDPSLASNPGEKIVWLLGLPHLPDNAWRVDALRYYNGITSDMPQYEVSTFDYKDTLRTLDQLHSVMSVDYKLTISPLGSKMQALGVALFCWMHPDVRVILAVPQQYNAAQYSEGCSDKWQLNFGALSKIRKVMERVGTFHIRE